MDTGFDVGDSVVHQVTKRKGVISDTRNARVPMVEVKWEDTGKSEWMPPEMVRKNDISPENEAARVFNQSNGDITKAYYAKMNARGLPGQLSVALFRAQKRSLAAKKYKKGAWRRDAYDVKNWSLSEVCRVLDTMSAFEMAPRWGWKKDLGTVNFEWVLYVDLPTGQCSFHSADRLNGPEYTGDWDGIGMSAERICRYCDLVAQD